ncbi:MAG: carbamoyltransferase HypF [Tannerellaceae bacterium]|jgi:hydrogenase maturation protein HypF|nr:carbamoyltransferase HypF [Tannerellaceae bacterium]
MHRRIYIRGLVQGVGFRPFVYRIAMEEGVRGAVGNYTGGVVIDAVFPSEGALDRFLRRVCDERPPVASIDGVEVGQGPQAAAYDTFVISRSKDWDGDVTQVAPDIAVCPECLNDRRTQARRMGYPFINCTHCGPRFSIVRDLPYDRGRTTMSVFGMCDGCREEYETVSDRRFHAQPVACNDCGPAYYALYRGVRISDYGELLGLAAGLLGQGEAIALKGVGGYHLLCDALDGKATAALREIKARDTKPFAVMFRDMETLRAWAAVSKAEEACLDSWRRPIVIVNQLRSLAPSVNPGMKTLGVMLPYMPVHYDLFPMLDTPALVVTSGNRGDMPVAVSEEEAASRIANVALVVHHNREIHNRVDDSVAQVCGTLPCLIRRARGYAPEPLTAGMDTDGALAFGAEEANTFAIGKGDTILQSQHIGDLKNWETFGFYTEAMERFAKLFRFTPRLLACDLHPDYLSSRHAADMSAATGLPLVRVQHHHAHAVACMTEYGLHRPVAAIVMDGSGLGDDGRVWGGEFMLCDRASYRRLSHLEYLPMPGGDRAALEPWRMAAACLYTWGLPFPAGFTARVGRERIERLCRMMERDVCTPLTSSAGRIFDAVASLLGLCDTSSRRAEAPVLLEQAAAGVERPYVLDTEAEAVSFRPVVEAILEDMECGMPVGYISARFHATMAHLIVDKAVSVMEREGVGEVVVSGGCFQNKYLTEMLQEMFASRSIPLYVPSRAPANDGGISVGQLSSAVSRTRTTRME